jgi:hypothetical protein
MRNAEMEAEVTPMRYTWALLILLMVAPLGDAAQKAKKEAVKPQVVTGCLDEKPGLYILRSDDALKDLAQLEPIGFEKEIFARYLGHKVSISGQLVEGAEIPTLRVSSPGAIKDISEMCVPGTAK